MVSRKALENLEVSLDGRHLNLDKLSSRARFGVANGEVAECSEAVRVWFGDSGANTVFHVVENGHVPFLMSIDQMHNLELTTSFRKDHTVWATSPHLNEGKAVQLHTTRAGHALFDMAALSDTSEQESDFSHSFVTQRVLRLVTPSRPAAIPAIVDGPAVGEHPIPAPRDEGAEVPPELQVKRAGEEKNIENQKEDLQKEDFVPIALRRLWTRLRDPAELQRIHLKHYHMSTSQWRNNMAELAVP